MRYIVALAVAGVLIGGVVLYIQQTDKLIAQAIRQALLKQQEAGTLPPELQGIDLQSADLSKLGDFQMQLPAGVERRLKLSYFLADFWYVWGPAVVCACLGVAVLLGVAPKGQK